MILRCQNCGASASLDAMISHEDARQALQLAFSLSGDLGRSLVRYLGLHRSETRELTMSRVASILKKLEPSVKSERIRHGGKDWPAPQKAWVWAIDKMVSYRDTGKLDLPIKGNKYLYSLIASGEWKDAKDTTPAYTGRRQDPATDSQEESARAIAAFNRQMEELGRPDKKQPIPEA